MMNLDGKGCLSSSSGATSSKWACNHHRTQKWATGT